MTSMADTYEQLLDATIQHLEDLKSRGVRHVAVSPETLASLARPATGNPQISSPKSQIDRAGRANAASASAGQVDDRQPARAKRNR